MTASFVPLVTPAVMPAVTPAVDSTLARLRRAFDEGFAQAPVPPVTAFDDLLAVRVGEAPYLLRLRELSGLAEGRRIVPLPAQRAALLGLAGVRGTLVGVYSLAVLLGRTRLATPGAWLALTGAGAHPVALAFESFERMLRVPTADVVPAPAPEPYATMVLRLGDVHRPIVDISAALAGLAPGGAGAVDPRRAHW